jgi:hypothetical protein
MPVLLVAPHGTPHRRGSRHRADAGHYVALVDEWGRDLSDTLGPTERLSTLLFIHGINECPPVVAW